MMRRAMISNTRPSGRWHPEWPTSRSSKTRLLLWSAGTPLLGLFPPTGTCSKLTPGLKLQWYSNSSGETFVSWLGGNGRKEIQTFPLKSSWYIWSKQRWKNTMYIGTWYLPDAGRTNMYSLLACPSLFLFSLFSLSPLSLSLSPHF